MCAWSQFLSEILINNPGMIDELLDSLVLNQPRTAEELRHELAELCRNADDPDPILHSFKDKELLRIGVRDILGKDTTIETTARPERPGRNDPGADRRRCNIRRWSSGFGMPTLPRAARAASRFVLLGLGKLGGREMSYHSDLDLILVYEGDGRTVPPPGSSRFDTFELTDNFHFFTELAQHIIKVDELPRAHGPALPGRHAAAADRQVGQPGDPAERVRPLLRRRRRAALGAPGLDARPRRLRRCGIRQEVMDDREQGGLRSRSGSRSYATRSWTMRERVQASGSERDLKRGFGGIIDIEFIVQMFRLKYGKRNSARSATPTPGSRSRPCESGRLHQPMRNMRRCAPATISCAWWRSACASSTTARSMNCPTTGRPGKAGPPHRHREVTETSSAAQKFLEVLERHATQTPRFVFGAVIKRKRGRWGRCRDRSDSPTPP